MNNAAISPLSLSYNANLSIKYIAKWFSMQWPFSSIIMYKWERELEREQEREWEQEWEREWERKR